MLSRRQVARTAPLALLVLAGLVSGIAGWAVRYTGDKEWQCFLCVFSPSVLGSILLFLVWMLSPAATRNQVRSQRDTA